MFEEQIEITCTDEEAARTEARRRQSLEPEGSPMEWIYLRNKSETWVARRVDNTPRPEKLTLKKLAEDILNAIPLR
jgi:hypothetical protein